MSDLSQFNWETDFLGLFDRCLNRFQSGDRDFARYYSDPDMSFLKSIGYKPREFFDFVEDWANDHDPNPIQAVMIAAVRRDYFKVVQGGKFSDHEIDPSGLTPKRGELEGIAWLPRIIEKAEAKLRGELDPDTMYCCGGDRAFLRRYNVHPADFLRVVWAAEGDRQYVVNYLKSH